MRAKRIMANLRVPATPLPTPVRHPISAGAQRGYKCDRKPIATGLLSVGAAQAYCPTACRRRLRKLLSSGPAGKQL